MSPAAATIRRFRTPLVTLAAFAVLNGVCQVLRLQGWWSDESYPRLVLISSIGAVWLIVLFWFAFWTRLPKAVRYTPVAITAVVVAAFLILFRIGYTGAMQPILIYRWGASDADLAIDTDIKPTLSARDTEPAAAPSSAGGNDFPQFLGPTRNSVVRGIRLARDWDARPPRVLWRQRIGAGWSAFAVVGDRAVTQEQRGPREMVTCYELRTGNLLWTHSDNVRYVGDLGSDGPRATPTIDAGKVYAVGATGLLNCIDLVSGSHLWHHDIVKENGAEVDFYGKSASPLVVDEKVIVSAGGPEGKSLVAYHKDTGERIWSGGHRKSAYASPMVMSFEGVRQVVVVNEDYLVGHDFGDGLVLWEHEWPGKSDTQGSNSQPHQVGGDRVFISKGYGEGGRLLSVFRNDKGGWATKTQWPNEDSPGRRVLKTKLSNVAIRDGFIYGLDDGILQCVALESGRQRWKRGRYEHGQLLLVEDLLLIRTESTGELVLVEANPEEHRELARFQALEPRRSWNHLCLAGRLLLIRNDAEAACLELATE